DRNVSNLDDPLFERNTADDRSAPRCEWMALQERVKFRRETCNRRRTVLSVFPAGYQNHFGVAKTGGRRNHAIERQFQVERRSADDVEHLGGRGLIVKGFP